MKLIFIRPHVEPGCLHHSPFGGRVKLMCCWWCVWKHEMHPLCLYKWRWYIHSYYFIMRLRGRFQWWLWTFGFGLCSTLIWCGANFNQFLRYVSTKQFIHCCYRNELKGSYITSSIISLYGTSFSPVMSFWNFSLILNWNIHRSLH